MKILNLVLGFIFVGLVIAAFMAPFGPTPGFTIGGIAADVPASWGDTESIEEIHLQVGEGPIGRTVIIWVVQIDGDLYITGQKDSGWTQGIRSGSAVRMQMAGNLYELNAVPVMEGQTQVLDDWLAKYTALYPSLVEGYPAPEEAVKTAAVFRLTARS
jgi:hypothetical protein